MDEVTVKIRVTKGDIAAGLRANCRTCPIARALQRRFRPTEVKVCHQFASLIWGQTYHQAPMPIKAATWLLAFDQGHVMQPFTFEIDVPRR